ncbi:NACHT domain-containing protein [Amycolatopsis sp. FU40]|uniref:NACHT domain-containing protein n=1 Tax=Amycolatopsis sp. FU40 TaxID=2914159 RepID=UPI001F393520|nr:NACHT domain-containing protein [Amycolatopsis sp. FU40]UKD57117.1 NACHT domain-containing protein [Amycolatopsis sp. FU40]
MTTSITTRVIANTSNAKGDVLTRLATDVFEALGYEKFRLNVHKSGRELDISASHKFESRTVVAECKAHEAPIGGSDVNKFAGVLDVERRVAKTADIVGYFLSLSGFTETALEQESSFSPPRIVTLNGEDIANILVEGKVVVSPARAAEVSGRFIHQHSPQLEFLERLELIGTSIGWVWSVHFGDSGTTAAVCLVHADGEVVSGIAEPSLRGAVDHPIIFRDGARSPQFEERFKSSYYEYLATEYGKITLEGLPADQHVGSKTFALEDLYVPLSLIDIEQKEVTDPSPARIEDSGDVDNSADFEEEIDQIADGKSKRNRRTAGGISIVDAISGYDRIAVLGPPGSGKTTILKRLCMAFLDPQPPDTEPDIALPYNAFPIVVRCRQIGPSATRPISEILDEVVIRAEMQEFAREFSLYIRDRLHAGRVVLLIDGLDEIPSQSDRAAFVAQLRTFVGRYPKVKLVVTSREVGFRIIAGAVGSICHTYRVDELSDENISLLCKLWHREVLGDRPDVESDALALAASIVSTDRVRRLAVNPLLLTTLLLVKRWVGQLPRRRTVLYQKAIEVLLMTWNVESHDPIDPEEALPQLAFAAYRMMVEGKASVTSPELADFFAEARSAVPEVLAYAKTSVHEFIESVEERSSLLVQSGQKFDGGQLRWVYEFKHLTFQEYLCALAIVNGYIPANVRSKEPSRLLGAKLKDPRWREVVGISAVLAGRKAVDILEHAMDLAAKIESKILKLITDPPSKSVDRTRSRLTSEYNSLLGNIVACLSDEVPIAPNAARKAIEFIIERGNTDWGFLGFSQTLAKGLLGGRYEGILRESVADGIRGNRNKYPSYVFTKSDILSIEASHLEADEYCSLIASNLNSDNFDEHISGALNFMTAAYANRISRQSREGDDLPELNEDDLKRLARKNAQEFLSEDHGFESLEFAIVWSLAWSIHYLEDDAQLNNDVQMKLLYLWRRNPGSQMSTYAAWAIRSSPLIGRWTIPSSEHDAIRLLVDKSFEQTNAFRNRDHRGAAIVVSCYLSLHSPEKIGEEIVGLYGRGSHSTRQEIAHAKKLLKLLDLPAGNLYEAQLNATEGDAQATAD